MVGVESSRVESSSSYGLHTGLLEDRRGRRTEHGSVGLGRRLGGFESQIWIFKVAIRIRTARVG